MSKADSTSTVEVYVFYFDVVGFVDDFLAQGDAVLERLRNFYRRARREFAFGSEHSYVVTLFDNVWARLNANELGMPSLLLDFAGHVMHAAEAEGFPRFFGAITCGAHTYDMNDRILVGGKSFEDLREQHIDATSEPHIRAALAEKWAAASALPKHCVWVSAEAVEPASLSAQAGFSDSAFEPFGGPFDLADTPLPSGRKWPFSISRFGAIRPKSKFR